MRRFSLAPSVDVRALHVDERAGIAYLAGLADGPVIADEGGSVRVLDSSPGVVLAIDLSSGTSRVIESGLSRPLSLYSSAEGVFWAAGFPMSHCTIGWVSPQAGSEQIALDQSGPAFVRVFDGVLIWETREVRVGLDTEPTSGLVGFDLATRQRWTCNWPVRFSTGWRSSGTTIAAFTHRDPPLAKQRWYESRARYFERLVAHGKATRHELWIFDVARREHTVRWREPTGSPVGLARLPTGWTWFREHDLDDPRSLVMLVDGSEAPTVVASRPGHARILGTDGDQLVIAWSTADERVAIERCRIDGSALRDVSTVAMLAQAPEVYEVTDTALWYVDASEGALVSLPFA